MREVIQVERQDGAAASPDSLTQLARVADELLPPLVARLGVSELGEIEVRQGAWRVRIRRAMDHIDGPTPHHAGPVGHGATSAAHSAGASGHAAAAGASGHAGGATASSDQPVARSTAVGYFGLRSGLAVGHRVARGDVLGWVDVLGVRMEIVSPADGVIERLVTEPGDPVEYGQDLVAILAATGPGSTAPIAPASDTARA